MTPNGFRRIALARGLLREAAPDPERASGETAPCEARQGEAAPPQAPPRAP